MSPSTMSFTEKIDVLDLLIEILMNHEKRLDELVARLELLVDQIDVKGSVPEAGLGGDPSAVDARIEDVE